jgi:hypothetical protein
MALQSTTAIATVTLQVAAPSVTFSGIPNNYRDLIIVSNNLGTVNNVDAIMRFNGDSGANYSRVLMYGLGATAGSGTDANQAQISLFFPRITVGASTTHIMDYSATDKHKTVLVRTDSPDYATFAGAGRWANSSAINSIYLQPNSGSFAPGATISLYGRIA